ncbi:MAG: hypothetical protein GXO08_01390 [Aquificae bacterium]|nr:hypothetical protein [Aquificota bacterium]
MVDFFREPGKWFLNLALLVSALIYPFFGKASFEAKSAPPGVLTVVFLILTAAFFFG